MKKLLIMLFLLGCVALPCFAEEEAKQDMIDEGFLKGTTREEKKELKNLLG